MHFVQNKIPCLKNTPSGPKQRQNIVSRFRSFVLFPQQRSDFQPPRHLRRRCHLQPPSFPGYCQIAIALSEDCRLRCSTLMRAGVKVGDIIASLIRACKGGGCGLSSPTGTALVLCASLSRVALYLRCVPKRSRA